MLGALLSQVTALDYSGGVPGTTRINVFLWTNMAKYCLGVRRIDESFILAHRSYAWTVAIIR